MTYDDDIIVKPPTKDTLVSEDGCKYLVIILTILMLLIALPSMLYQTYEDPLPGIVALGLAALTLSILYLATKIEQKSEAI